MKLSKDELDTVLERATEDWTGEGHWLQISGFAFTHDPRKVEGDRVDVMKLLRDGKLTEIPNRPLQVVTNRFLSEGGDGYTILRPLKKMSVAGSLKERLHESLRMSAEPIQPRVEGRICNIAKIATRPCLFKDIQ
jgi:hypothetical protein